MESSESSDGEEVGKKSIGGSAERQKARKARRDIAHPYARKQKDTSQAASAAKEDRRGLLLSERKRVTALPKGKYSIHRLKVIARALELLDELDGEGVSSRGSNGKCELDDLLKQLSLR